MKMIFYKKLKKLSRLVRSMRYIHGLRYRIAAAIEHENALRSVDVATLIDVGANVGQFSLMASSVHPGIKIHAFEPLKDMAERYARFFNGHPRVVLHQVAAGEQPGVAEINVSGRPDSSSLLPITAQQDAIFPGTAAVSVERVQVERIDDLLSQEELPEPIMIKLDVQGFELAALKGMPNILSKASYVYCEVSFVELYSGQPLASDIISWLASRGMGISGVHNASFMPNGATVQADILFSRR